MAPRDASIWVTFLIVPPLAFMSALRGAADPLGLRLRLLRLAGLARGDFVGFRNFRDVLVRRTLGAGDVARLRHNVYGLRHADDHPERLRLPAGLWLLSAPFGYRFHRVAVFLPVILSTVIVALLWKQFLQPGFGLFNKALNTFGFGMDDAVARRSARRRSGR